MLRLYATVAIVLSSTALGVDSFRPSCRVPTPVHPPTNSVRPSTALHNFFKDVLGAAFENDSNLSQNNKRAGMLDAAVEGEGDGRSPQLTSTQQAWRQRMMPTTVSPADLEGTSITVDMYLVGVSNKDPSNDLYGSKTNISSRDRVVGQILPVEPTVTGVQVVFLANNKCEIKLDDNTDRGFCKTDQLGDWKLSDGDKDRQIRFRLAVTGYTRTVQTKGTIQKIYWSSQGESTTQTSTSYSIPEGWLYFEADVSASKGPGKPVQWSDGVVKVEKSMGLLGVASRMIPCGKFTARPVVESL